MTETKTINFEGRSYTVPVWVEWVAWDSDGAICGYKSKPELSTECFYPVDGEEEKWVTIFVDTSWRDSLTKV